MTGLGDVAAGSGPAVLGEIRSVRAAAARQTAAGDPAAAGALVAEALARTRPAADRSGLASLPWRVERVALLAELAVAAMSAGAVERLEEALLTLRDELAGLGPPEALQRIVGGRCRHLNWTADPSGACMAKPPCPP